MLRACGGTGYKTHLGIERLLRDGKAAWVLGPSKEKVKQIIGKTVLENHEVADLCDFDNPFNTCPPAVNDKMIKTVGGENHYPTLKPGTWVSLILKSTITIRDKMASFVFALPEDTDHTGCFPGQYVAAESIMSGKEHVLYFSPVSPPDHFGITELVLRFETHGIMSQHFKALKPGDRVEFQGSCGRFEYTPKYLHELLASGVGITSRMHLVRSILKNSADKTNTDLLYFTEYYNEILYKEELDKYKGEHVLLL
ncbi:hypothetical protein O3P69_018972 [Scylla paramamosain]|uniref:FAD-binding FR-type domain-containing protein n=1 Tax=Scylla paramamosain TaxID=85552 RepID=A0AAW0SBR9_SCYPA